MHKTKSCFERSNRKLSVHRFIEIYAASPEPSMARMRVTAAQTRDAVDNGKTGDKVPLSDAVILSR
jgi:hypothetical protein